MSDLRQRLERLRERMQERVILEGNLGEKNEIETWVEELDALVRAASPPAPPKSFVREDCTCGHARSSHGTDDGMPGCRFCACGIFESRSPDGDGPLEVQRSVRLEDRASDDAPSVSERSRAEIKPNIAGSEPADSHTIAIDTDVVRGRVDGAAGGVRSAGPPQEEEAVTEHCPRCDSPAPHLHPAVQFEGEVQPCPDPFHFKVTNQNPPYAFPEKAAGGAAGPQAPPPQTNPTWTAEDLPEVETATMPVHLREWARLIREAEDQQTLLDIADDLDASAEKLARGDAARVPPTTPPCNHWWHYVVGERAMVCKWCDARVTEAEAANEVGAAPATPQEKHEYRSGWNSIEGEEKYPMYQASTGVSLMALFKQAANDESLTDREVRNIVRYLSADPINERDVERTKELAAKYGWRVE